MEKWEITRLLQKIITSIGNVLALPIVLFMAIAIDVYLKIKIKKRR